MTEPAAIIHPSLINMPGNMIDPVPIQTPFSITTDFFKLIDPGPRLITLCAYVWVLVNIVTRGPIRTLSPKVMYSDVSRKHP